MDLSPLPNLLVPEFYVNIHDISRSIFRVFLRSMTVKVTPDVISSTIYIFHIVHPLFPYLSANTLPVNSLIQSTLFNSPLEGSSIAIRTGSLLMTTKFCCILCAQICGQDFTPLPCLWRKQGLFMRCCMVTLLTCLFSFVTTFLCTFRVPDHRTSLPYACLIHCLVISPRVKFLGGVSEWISSPIGQVRVNSMSLHLPFLLRQMSLLIQQCLLILLVIFSRVIPLISHSSISA